MLLPIRLLRQKDDSHKIKFNHHKAWLLRRKQVGSTIHTSNAYAAVRKDHISNYINLLWPGFHARVGWLFGLQSSNYCPATSHCNEKRYFLPFFCECVILSPRL